MPMKIVKGIKSCWFGFFSCLNVAERSWTPESSWAEIEPLRRSPYLEGLRVESHSKLSQQNEHEMLTLRVDPWTIRWCKQPQKYKSSRLKRLCRFLSLVVAPSWRCQLFEQRRSSHRKVQVRHQNSFHCVHHLNREHQMKGPSSRSSYPKVQQTARLCEENVRENEPSKVFLKLPKKKKPKNLTMIASTAWSVSLA